MKFKKTVFFILIIAFAAFFSYSVSVFLRLPNKFIVMDGENEKNIGKLFSARIEAGNSGVLKDGVYTISSGKNYTANIKIFGIAPIKKTEAEVIENRKVTVCGSAIGIKLYTDGVCVADLNPAENGKSPADVAGIKPGDFITHVNGEKITDIKSLKAALKKSGSKKTKVKILRNSKEKEFEIIPVHNKESDEWRMGILAKDSTAGIGTLTFYDSQTNTFGALGHGISGDTGGEILILKNGSASEAKIIDVKKGVPGSPGELQGVFGTKDETLGKISKNTKFGIFGTADGKITEGEEHYMGSSDKIAEGKAYILTTVSGSKPERYEIEILKVMRFNSDSTKGMVIKVTDKRLIEKTGGIVRGMSGSPIIQNDLLIGAVTHVFVNDPTRGYGTFIENMISEAQTH